MGAHTGRRLNSSSTSTTTRARLSPTSINKAGDTKVRTRQRRDLALRRKMEALRRIVPSDSGGDDEVDELLLRAAGYIARLQAQVRVMQLMVDVLEHAQD